MIVKSEKTDFESYLQDAANIMGNCERVYFVETEDEISSIVSECNKTKTQSYHIWQQERV